MSQSCPQPPHLAPAASGGPSRARRGASRPSGSSAKGAPVAGRATSPWSPPSPLSRRGLLSLGLAGGRAGSTPPRRVDIGALLPYYKHIYLEPRPTKTAAGVFLFYEIRREYTRESPSRPLSRKSGRVCWWPLVHCHTAHTTCACVHGVRRRRGRRGLVSELSTRVSGHDSRARPRTPSLLRSSQSSPRIAYLFTHSPITPVRKTARALATAAAPIAAPLAAAQCAPTSRGMSHRSRTRRRAQRLV